MVRGLSMHVTCLPGHITQGYNRRETRPRLALAKKSEAARSSKERRDTPLRAPLYQNPRDTSATRATMLVSSYRSGKT